MSPEFGIVVALATYAAASALFGFWLGRRIAHNSARKQALELRADARQSGAAATAASRVLDAVLDTVPDGVLVLDEGLVVVRANRVAETWFGGTEPLQGLSLLAATRSSELQELARYPDPPERTVRARNLTLLAIARPLSGGGSIIALRDDTRLERLERSRRDLVANLSHDIRTPLTSIGLLAETLIERPPEDPARLRAVAVEMETQVALLRSMADGLIDLSRLEEGRSIFRLSPESLLSIVTETIDSLAPQIRERDVRLSVEVSPEVTVLADRPALSRGLSNVLDNAVRYSPRGGVIVIAADDSGPEEVVVRVRDTGPGIAAAERERVFERFFRGDRSRGSEGAGLGLAIARHVMRGHGGDAEIESSGGSGTTVRLTLIKATQSQPPRPA